MVEFGWNLVCIQCVTPKSPTFFKQKRRKKGDTLGTFTQNVPFLEYNKTKKEKSGTLWGHGLYMKWHPIKILVGVGKSKTGVWYIRILSVNYDTKNAEPKSQ